jgi:hexosaminidase
VLRPELPKTIVVQSWRGAASLKRAASLGYDGILSNGYYLDHMQPASFHYRNDPLPDGSDAEARRHVLGGEACMWGEFVSPETIDSRVWPRAAAVAERLWSRAEVRDVPDMYRRLEIQSTRLTALGLTHQSGYVPMLQRLMGRAPVEPLRALADVVEPLKLYARGGWRAYTSATPLDRLVDAARPESDTARGFKTEAERFLGSAAPRDGARLRAPLLRWRDNHAVLEPLLAASPAAAETRPLSRDLAELAGLGLSALDAIAAGAPPPPPAREEWHRTLERAQKPHAELLLAVGPTIRKLALAAEELETLQTLPAAQWNAWLDDRLAQRPPAGER